MRYSDLDNPVKRYYRNGQPDREKLNRCYQISFDFLGPILGIAEAREQKESQERIAAQQLQAQKEIADKQLALQKQLAEGQITFAKYQLEQQKLEAQRQAKAGVFRTSPIAIIALVGGGLLLIVIVLFFVLKGE